MKHAENRYLLARIFLLLTLPLAQGWAEGNEATDSNWGEVHAGFRLSLSIKNHDYERMEPIVAVLVLSNTTDRVLDTVRTSVKDAFKIRITDAQGNPVPVTRYGDTQLHGRKSSTVAPMGVQPGKTFTEEILVNRLYDLTLPGVYSVEVSRIVADTEAKGWTFVTSNIVQLRIPD
ncbi:MAG: hypothetical protein BWY82_01138 [Verrucomicrobia bacterium ADurb.Bin474]|nr:MAG: hypothetical protein BWY82_01138 [Verrucomicrobia bacterium ADurb.Bin474]